MRLLVLIVGIATILSSCGRDSLLGRCSTDSDCQDGQSCVSGLCSPDQTTEDVGGDTDCEPGVNCGATCSSDDECAENEACNPLLGLCVSTDCFENEGICLTNVCDENGCESDVCVLRCPPSEEQIGCECQATGCETSDQCDGQVCVDGQCAPCSDDSQCEGELICTDEGFCAEDERCQDDSDCAANQQCNAEGLCIPRPDCILDQDCRDDEICFNGRCTFSPECTVDQDCPDGFECIGEQCFEEICRGPDDCEAPLICDAGECVNPPRPDNCFVATVDQTITNNQSIPLDAFAFDDMGASIAATFEWTSSNNGVASISGTSAVGGNSAGNTTVTAVATTANGDTIRCSDNAVLTNPGPISPNDLRIVVTDAETGAPVDSARVVVDGTWVGTTLSTGLLTTPKPQGQFDVTVFQTDYDYVTVKNVSENEIRLPLKRASGFGPAAGFTGNFDFSNVNSSGTINIGLAGASLRGGLLDVNLLGILGDNFVTNAAIPGFGDFDLPLPGGLVLFGAGFDIKQMYYARTTGGPRFAWGLAGKVPFTDLISLFMNGGLDGDDILATILPLFNRFDHEAFPQILTELPQVQDTNDIDGDFDTTELLPNYAAFPTIDLAPDVQQNLSTDVGVSNFPFLTDGQAGVAVIVGGTSLPSTGFVPLGISATSDSDGDGRPDTQRLSMAPNHGPLVGGRYAVLAIAFSGAGGGIGPNGFELPPEFSVAMFNGQSFPTNIGLGTFPDATFGSVVNRQVSFVADAGPLYRVRVVSNDRTWEVWDVGPAQNMGQFTHNIEVPSTIQGVTDIFQGADVFVDAIQTNVDLDDIVGGTGVGLSNAGFLSSAFNRTQIR